MYVPVSKSNLKSLDRQSWLQWASALRDRNLENVDVCTGTTPKKPAASVSSKGSLTAQWTSFSKPGKHHVIWATSPAPGVFTIASLIGIKTGLECCIESKQRWKYLHGAEEGGGDRGQKEMEVALGCYLWGVWTVPWVSLPCPQHWRFPGFYGYADSCSLHCFCWLVTAFDLWLPQTLNRIKGQRLSLAHGLCRWSGKKLFYWALPCVAFPPSLIATQAQKRKLRLCFSVVGMRHNDGEPQHTDEEALLNFFCVTNGIKNWLSKMEGKNFFLFHQHFSPVVICSFPCPQTKTKPAKISEMYWKPKKSVGENGTTQGFNFSRPLPALLFNQRKIPKGFIKRRMPLERPSAPLSRSEFKGRGSSHVRRKEVPGMETVPNKGRGTGSVSLLATCVCGVQTVLSLLAMRVSGTGSLCWVCWPCVFMEWSLCSKLVGCIYLWRESLCWARCPSVFLGLSCCLVTAQLLKVLRLRNWGTAKGAGSHSHVSHSEDLNSLGWNWRACSHRQVSWLWW